MKPFRDRLKRLLKKISGHKSVKFGEIIKILPELTSQEKKLIKVRDLILELGCEITGLGADIDAPADLDSAQFNQKEDLDAYPRTIEADAVIAEEVGCDVIFAPTAEDLYGGEPKAEHIDWGDLTNSFEGKSSS